MSGPPGKRNAAPENPGHGSFSERLHNPTPAVRPQDSALAELCKTFIRAEPAERLLFLCDIRTAEPLLWRDVERWFVESFLERKGHARAQ